MGWAIGYDGHWERDIGYGVPAECDHPDCETQIDRGLSYVCGGEPYGGERGCGLFFCEAHLFYNGPGDEDEEVEIDPSDDSEEIRFETHEPEGAFVCERCRNWNESDQEGYFHSFEPKRDVEEWILHKLTDPSWATWRRREGKVYRTLEGTLTT